MSITKDQIIEAVSAMSVMDVEKISGRSWR